MRALPPLVQIILTPLRGSDVNTDLPGPIFNRAALFTQRLLREVKFAEPGTPAEDHAFTKLFLAYKLVFKKALRGERRWRKSAGRLASITPRLVRAEEGDFTGLSENMVKAHKTLVEL